MIEKVLESWLDKSTERSFQIPVANLLSMNGYKIVHITRHCSLEHGKDIIAIDENDVPCAFQLKTAKNSKFALKDWQDCNAQIRDLAYLKITHPSIGEYKGSHRSFLVTNGYLEEEATSAINKFNETLIDDGRSPIEVISKGDILDLAKKAYPSIFPTELKDIKLLLEFFTEDGSSYLPKQRFAELLESIFSFDTKQKISKATISRTIGSVALVTSLALTQYALKGNWIAEIEGWTIYLATLFAAIEKWKLGRRLWQDQLFIAENTIFNSLSNLLEEVKGRQYLFEGDPISDIPFYRVRVTYVMSLLSIFAIWKLLIGDKSEIEFIDKFINKYKNALLLWGEAAIPQLLSYYWYYRNIDATLDPDRFLGSLINNLAISNNPNNSKEAISPPYYEANEIIPYRVGSNALEHEDNFKGRSFFLNGLMQLFARRNLKQFAKSLWPKITYVNFTKFIPENKWRFYLRRNKRGTYITQVPQKTMNWSDLRKEARTLHKEELPFLMLKYPHLLLLFVIVYPYRATPSVLKLLDDEFRVITYGA